jgi:hypothetical protein
MARNNDRNTERYPPLKDDAEGGGDGTSTSLETETISQSTKAKNDETLVKRARVTVMMVLLVSAATVAALAYFILTANEYDSFVAQVCVCALSLDGCETMVAQQSCTI